MQKKIQFSKMVFKATQRNLKYVSSAISRVQHMTIWKRTKKCKVPLVEYNSFYTGNINNLLTWCNVPWFRRGSWGSIYVQVISSLIIQIFLRYIRFHIWIKKNIFSSMIQFLEFDYNVSFSHNLANSLYIFAIDPFTKT